MEHLLGTHRGSAYRSDQQICILGNSSRLLIFPNALRPSSFVRSFCARLGLRCFILLHKSIAIDLSRGEQPKSAHHDCMCSSIEYIVLNLGLTTSEVQENNPHLTASLQSQELYSRNSCSSPRKIPTKALLRCGGYIHQELARLRVSSLSMADIQVKYCNGNWIYNLHLGCEVQQGEDTDFCFMSDETRHCLSLQSLEQYLFLRVLRYTRNVTS